MPLFFEETTTLFRYLPENAVFAMIGNVNEAFQRFWADTQSRYNFLKSDRERPLLAPEKLFLTSEDFFVLAQPFARWVIQTDDAPSDCPPRFPTYPSTGVQTIRLRTCELISNVPTNA